MSLHPPLLRPIQQALVQNWPRSNIPQLAGGVPKENLVFLTDKNMVDIIGISISDYLLIPEEMRSIYFADESTIYDAETIISNIEASAFFNSGRELVGVSGSWYAQYTDGTDQNILEKAYSKAGETYPSFAYSTSIFSGDSTLVAYSGASSVPSLIDDDLAAAQTSLAVAGETTLQQKTHFDDLATKANAKYVVIQTGLNDITPSDSAATIIGRLQSFVDSILAATGPQTKIIISKMTPARQRYFDLYGAVGGATCYTTWQAVNEAIAGHGATPITSVDGRVTSHADAMSDGSGNLDAAYDTGDHVHPNNVGKEINATAIEAEIHLLFNGIAPFSFALVTDQAVSTLVESSAVALSVATGGRTFTASGGEVQINDGSWVTSGTFADGDVIKARCLSSSENSTSTSVTVTTGETSRQFTVSTVGDEILIGGIDPSDFVQSNQLSGATMTIVDTIAARRITVTGIVTRVVARWKTPPNVSRGAQFRVYREVGTDYVHVASSETITTGSAPPNNSEYVLSTPLSCQSGDIVGVYFPAAGTEIHIKTTSSESNAIAYKNQNVTTSLPIADWTKISNHAINLAYYGVEQ